MTRALSRVARRPKPASLIRKLTICAVAIVALSIQACREIREQSE